MLEYFEKLQIAYSVKLCKGELLIDRVIERPPIAIGQQFMH